MGNAPSGDHDGLVLRNETGVLLTCGEAKLERPHKGNPNANGGGQGG